MNDINATVPDAGTDGVVTTPTTPDSSGQAPSSGALPTASQDAKPEDIQLLKSQIAKYEQDVRKIKSSSDKRVAELERTFSQREAEMRVEVENAILRTMDEKDRNEYLQMRDAREREQLAHKANQTDVIESEYQSSLQAISYFTNLGVPLDQLVMDQGYDTLFNSGWEWLTADYRATKEALKSTPKSVQPPLPPQAPPVATSNGGVPNTKPEWPELVKRFGSMENVFKAVETGRLDPSIIPLD